MSCTARFQAGTVAARARGVPFSTAGILSSGVRSRRSESSQCNDIPFLPLHDRTPLARLNAARLSNRSRPLTSGLPMPNESCAYSSLESRNSRPSSMLSWPRSDVRRVRFMCDEHRERRTRVSGHRVQPTQNATLLTTERKDRWLSSMLQHSVGTARARDSWCCNADVDRRRRSFEPFRHAISTALRNQLGVRTLDF